MIRPFLTLSFLLLILINSEAQKLPFVFESGRDGYDTFRIPAMVTSNEGTILAFAEGRKKGSSDTGDIDIVLKKSIDNGKTWSPLKVVWDQGENVCGNPAPVVDRTTGTIHVLLTWNKGEDHESQIIDQTSEDTRRVFVIKSIDDGESWTEPKEITSSVKKENWTWYATGPGQGIQLEKGDKKGRLVIPCDHIEAGTKKYFSHTVYSDDHGATWKLGGSTPQDQVNECMVAELSNGDLMLNMRNYDRTQKARKVAISKDGGQSWSDIYSDPVLIESICQASFYRYSFKKSRLLFLNPASENKRENMTLRISYDEGKSWAVSTSIYKGPSAYSDLVRLDNGDIACFYEAGYENPYEGIVFQVFKLKDLEE